jgi:uncharacterized membrane protein (UPF0127 family)
VASWLSPILREPERKFRIANARTGAVIADLVVAAVDSRSRNRGLLGRDGMEPGEALIIAPTNAIHTWFMRFDIDVAFTSRDGRVLKLREAMRPWRLAAAMRGFAVVETAAGAFASSSTQAGDSLKLESA